MTLDDVTTDELTRCVETLRTVRRSAFGDAARKDLALAASDAIVELTLLIRGRDNAQRDQDEADDHATHDPDLAAG